MAARPAPAPTRMVIPGDLLGFRETDLKPLRPYCHVVCVCVCELLSRV